MPYHHLQDCAIHYEIYGSGAPLLLLHGLGSRGEDWRPSFAALTPHYRVIAPDFRGHGGSDKPDMPYRVPLHAADMLGLLDALGLGAVHVAGLSMGGMVAFQMAADAPQRIASLTIINSGPVLPSDKLMVKLLIQMRVWMMVLGGMRWYGRKIAKGMFPKPEQERLRGELAQQIASNPRHIYMRALKGLVGFDVQSSLPAMDRPTLVISGDRDYTPVSMKQAYVDRMPNARLEVVTDSGHGTPFDQAGILNGLLLDFLGKLNGNPRQP